jgi:predicted esterase
MSTNGFWLLSVLLLVFEAQTAGAQQAEIRYELGQRIRAFEMAWDAQANDAETKKRVAPVVNQAVQNYFRFNFPAVAKTIDQARHLLHSSDEVPGAVRWAEALSVVAESHLLDTSTTELAVTIKPFYKTDVDAPAKPVVRFKLGDGKTSEFALSDFPRTIKVPLPVSKGSADTILNAEIASDEKTLATKAFGVSRIEKLDERLNVLKAVVEKLPTPRTTIEQATLAQHVKLLDGLARKIPQETDYPAARLFIEAEELAKAADAVFTGKRSGEYWLSIPTGKTLSAVRIQIPEKLTDKPVPVVVALHGMGGSENMFFDAYGNGIVPKLAKERGWIVVATRVEGLLGAGPAPAVPAILDELQKRYPIDAKRVFLIGHSMGAGHVLQLTQQAPERYAAAAALGGGGRVAKAEAVKNIPFFVGCGKLDFALSGAKALAKSLDAGSVTFKEYDDIEHLVIVRAAAPEVFKFFETLKR